MIKIRKLASKLVEATWFQNFILIVIVINAVTIGIQTAVTNGSTFSQILTVIDTSALIIFIIEILLKFIAYGIRGFFKDPWNVFDFLIVAIAIVPGANSLSVLRALRVIRLLRVVKFLPQLRRIVDAMLNSIPGVGAIALLLVLIFYVSSVMATSLFGERFPQWFGSIGKSAYSLFQITTLESWSMGIVRPVMEVYPNAWMFFVPFILITAFVVLNLFIAVIVDAMSTLSYGEDTTETNTDNETSNQNIKDINDKLEQLSMQMQKLHTEISELRTPQNKEK